MNSFALIMGLGASLGLWMMIQKIPRSQTLNWLQTGLFVYIFALLGARLSYILLYSTYYVNSPLEIVQIWKGGFTWPGAVFCGFLGLWIASLIYELPFNRLLDGFSECFPPLIIAVWLGAWTRGLAYGFEVPSEMVIGIQVIDEMGITATRFPLQFIAALVTLFFYTWFENRKSKFEIAGQKGSFSLLFFSGTLLVFSFLRSDPAPVWGEVRLNTWLALLFFVISLITFVILFFQPIRDK
ncbi:MAG: prolipoprotein diacylglyceryl transferase [Anaerolineaceae bacterium]|nr:prolipoprotein diacylglyceryl transferase [Anaerolineaceae bacterium]